MLPSKGKTKKVLRDPDFPSSDNLYCLFLMCSIQCWVCKDSISNFCIPYDQSPQFASIASKATMQTLRNIFKESKINQVPHSKKLQSHLFAISSETWRSGQTWRALFTSYPLRHFDAGRSATNLGWLAQTTLALGKGRESGRFVCMTIKLKDAKSNTYGTSTLTFSPLRPGRPRPGSPFSPCQKINIILKWYGMR